jgi:serine phosphatase RsbU (regulator of sigma subunit)
MVISTKYKLTLGLIFFALMVINVGVSTYSAIAELRSPYDGWFAERTETGQWRIQSVDPRGPAHRLKAGDLILNVNGVRPEDDRRALNQAQHIPIGSTYSIEILRDGVRRELRLQILPRPFLRPPLFWIGTLAQKVVYPLIFLIPALVVFLLKPGDKQALLLSLFLATFCSFISYPVPPLPLWLLWITFLARTLATVFWPILFHFFLVFPESPAILARRRWIERVIYLPYLLFILPSEGIYRYWSMFDGTEGWRQRTAESFGAFGAFLQRANFLTICLYVLGGILMLVVNYRRVERNSRRKMRVAVFGSLLGFLVVFLLLVVETRLPQYWQAFQIIGLTALPLIPLSFTYAIVRHKVIPISLIIRRGIRYFLVSQGSIAIEVLTVGVVTTVILDSIYRYYEVPPLAVGVLSAIVGIIMWVITRTLHDRYLAPLIDRKFFRQSYNAQQILSDLAESMRVTSEQPKLLESVAEKIQTALQTENVTIFLREESSGDYVSTYRYQFDLDLSLSEGRDEALRIHSSSRYLRDLAESGQPMEVETSENGLHATETESLRSLNSTLLLPLAGKDGMRGVISLGPRLGDLPYSNEDKRLLMSVAGPTTFALENARLIEHRIEDARRRQELEAENEARAKELEEARQLQLSMLPKSVPLLPHLEIAAYMKPATEVGGDYYDFHLGADGTLTVVIGDATGHGLKAGTVVTATKSLFNHLATAADIPGIFQQSSSALKKMNLRGLFMALTLVRVEERAMILCAAGMPPALVFHAGTRTVDYVQLNGAPLGSVSDYHYRERRIELSCGDVVLLMSDGFPERFNPQCELLEMDPAIELLRKYGDLSPAELIDHLVEAGDAWAQGAAQNDDVTFVVLKRR